MDVKGVSQEPVFDAHISSTTTERGRKTMPHLMSNTSLRVVSLCTLLMAAAGCAQCLTVQGYCTGDAVELAGVKRWSAATLRTGWELQGYLGSECGTKMEAWCNEDGDWGIYNRIDNRADAHLFVTMMEFGHVEGSDFRTFAPISSHQTGVRKVARDENQVQVLAGGADPSIRANFDRINAVRPTVVVADDSLIHLWSKTTLTAMPNQPWK